jgi:hypothetical protein
MGKVAHRRRYPSLRSGARHMRWIPASALSSNQSWALRIRSSYPREPKSSTIFPVSAPLAWVQPAGPFRPHANRNCADT